uniref:Shootin-1 n=1 Tax=Branchiostoma floridae TaxID=7739 RepID=C3Z489_BRAFL|eukprot:XP_002596690.1 hypothetical protein BRAFLDRAFT_78411 [Branchiostoma floridae]
MELLDEFDPALPMGAHYCSNKLTAEEYEQQGSEATRQALMELQETMKQNPELYRQVLGKKRIDEGNVFSKLKLKAVEMSYDSVSSFNLSSPFSLFNCSLLQKFRNARSPASPADNGKLMTAVKGDEYGREKVTELETQVKMAELHEEMFKVYEYAQEERTMTRKSKRLAEKRAKKVKEQPTTPEKSASSEGDTYTTPPQFVPPPPPPYPPPVLGTPMALRERTNMQSTPAPAAIAKKKTSDKNGSPGGTPYYRPRHARPKLKAVEMSYDSVSSFNLSSPFSLFNCSLLQKFRNARSPASPADNVPDSPHSPANFSP